MEHNHIIIIMIMMRKRKRVILKLKVNLCFRNDLVKVYNALCSKAYIWAVVAKKALKRQNLDFKL